MTEPAKLDEPLADADYDELEAFLASNGVPQDCMDLEMLDGFLTAIVSGTAAQRITATTLTHRLVACHITIAATEP